VAIHKPVGEWYTYAPEWWLLDCTLSLGLALEGWKDGGVGLTEGLDGRSAVDGVCQLVLWADVCGALFFFFDSLHPRTAFIFLSHPFHTPAPGLYAPSRLISQSGLFPLSF